MVSVTLATSVEGQKKHYYTVKRIMDFILALMILFLLLPLLVIISIFIKLDSAGPIIFIQERVGSRRCYVNGKVSWEIRNFRFYKFRSMSHNAGENLHEEHIRNYINGELPSSDSDPTQPSLKVSHDPRVTRMGRLLRRTSLDELPQLINVIKGEMSLVGPRPVPTYEFASYQQWSRERMAALPGITGLWQVKGRCLLSFKEQIELDIAYVHEQSLWLDMKILLLTIPAVLTSRGAE